MKMSSGLNAMNKIRYEGLFDACKKIMKTEGIRGFYRGLGPSLILVIKSFMTI